MALFHPAAALYSRKLLPDLKDDMIKLRELINLDLRLIDYIVQFMNYKLFWRKNLKEQFSKFAQ